jgi:hypothetical protein
VRGFSDADLIQSNGGTATAVSTVDATVGAGTAEGNAGLIVVHAASVSNSPANWDPVVTDTGGGLQKIFLRADLPAGESLWTFTAAAAGSWLWTVGEWANFAAAPLQGSSTAFTGIAPATSSTGSTGTFSAQFAVGVAAFTIINGSASAAVWPSAVSYDNSFTETDSLQIGTGTGVGDRWLKVARRYGTDSDAGPWSCTATFTGSMANKSVYATLAVFGAQETADVPMGVVTG